MGYAQRGSVTLTTDGSGAADVTFFASDGNAFSGELGYLSLTIAGLDATADITITAATTGVVLYSVTNTNVNVTKFPRAPTCDTAGVASLYAAGGEPVEDRIPLAQEGIRVVVAQGGASKSATILAVVV